MIFQPPPPYFLLFPTLKHSFIFSHCFQRKITFMTSSLLSYKTKLIRRREEKLTLKEEKLPLMRKYFPFKVDSLFIGEAKYLNRVVSLASVVIPPINPIQRGGVRGGGAGSLHGPVNVIEKQKNNVYPRKSFTKLGFTGFRLHAFVIVVLQL